MTDYERIEKAIGYLKTNFRSQPNLDELAREICLSPFHFQRMFKEWAGVSPKKFKQFLSIEYAKDLLSKNVSLAEASYETGFSSTSRLHDLFVTIEGMSPGMYKNGGENLQINYSFAPTPFGEVIIASTEKGICHLAFADNQREATETLTGQFPKAKFTRQTDASQQNALRIFSGDWNNLKEVKLHLKGTDFQLKVWQALLQIPFGEVSTYGAIAGKIEQANAARAVGTAIGSNPVAFLIPCHRVIRSTGVIGDYHWGASRKAAIFGWEAAHSAG